MVPGVCLPQVVSDQCLREEILHLSSLGWILIVALKSHMLLETIFLSVSLKVSQQPSKIKMLS